jgi:hypothetical protein
MNDTTWQPGDPLHPRGSYRDYAFNFRDDSVGEQPGPDAASWPDPGTRYVLPADDEVTAFIEAHRRWTTTFEESA